MTGYEERLKNEKHNLKLAVYFAKQFIDEFGNDKALEAIKRAWAQYGTDNWNTKLEGVPPEKALKVMGEWFKAQAEIRSELKVVEATPKRLCIEFTKCPTYDVCKELEVPEICQMYCDSDYSVIPLMYPKIKLVRDKELAYGADRCNHCWVMEE